MTAIMEDHHQDMEVINVIDLGLWNTVVGEEEEVAAEAPDTTEEEAVDDTTIDMNKTTADMIDMIEEQVAHHLPIEWIDKAIEVVKGIILLNLRTIIEVS